MQRSHVLNIDVWIDYICPYCYLHREVLKQLIPIYGPNVHIRWHPLEVRPNSSALPDARSERRTQEWNSVIYRLALERGISIAMPSRIARSRFAFEAARWAATHGAFDSMHDALFDGYFLSDLDIGAVDALADIARAVAPQVSGLRTTLTFGMYAAEVEKHLTLARTIGASGTPFTLLSRPKRDTVRCVRHVPVALRGAAPLHHFHMAIARLFPEGFDVHSYDEGLEKPYVPLEESVRPNERVVLL